MEDRDFWSKQLLMIFKKIKMDVAKIVFLTPLASFRCARRKYPGGNTLSKGNMLLKNLINYDGSRSR